MDVPAGVTQEEGKEDKFQSAIIEWMVLLNLNFILLQPYKKVYCNLQTSRKQKVRMYLYISYRSIHTLFNIGGVVGLALTWYMKMTPDENRAGVNLYY